MMRFAFAALLGSGCAISVARAAEPPAVDAAQMATVVVSGEQPGPGLWKVSRGDHVLWILGTLAPLPKDIEWKSKEVDAVLAQAQELLDSPQVGVDADIGFFGKLALLPSLVGVRKNPDDATLKEVIPADLYARWLVLKEKYIGRSSRVEEWRPIFAAVDLYESAIRKSGLTDSGLAQKAVKSAAKRAGVPIVETKVQLRVEDPRKAIKEFKNGSLDDVDCFRKTLDRIDTDLETMRERANAWATADLQSLRSLTYTDQLTACRNAVVRSDLARERGLSDIEQRIKGAWLVAADRALSNNRVTLALLPITELVKEGGYVAALRSRGLVVEAPDERSDDPLVEPASTATEGTPAPIF
ncbi:MAG: TraB/GumN family protein [Dokdonella sp.]|uniref:TraB/GumN family protein n=1 Tax=Dokdonella sp. TaxID=2291710 RepID=UPI003267A61F